MARRFARALHGPLGLNRSLAGIVLFVGIALFTGIAGAEDPLEKVSERGPVKATVRLTPMEPRIGDTVDLTIEVRAEADVELLMPEFGEALEQFLIVNYKPIPDQIDADGKTVAAQQYTLQPRVSGRQSIPPILIEFVDHRPDRQEAPDGEDAYELLTERLDFEVQSVLPEGAAPELKSILDEIPPPAPPIVSRWPVATGVLVLLALASPFLLHAFFRWRRRSRRRSAYEIARVRLEGLISRGVPEGEALNEFFVEISAIIRVYIEDRFEVRAPEYTTEEFLDIVSDSPDVSHEHQRLLREFLRQADLVKFARALPTSTDVDRSVELARQFLQETREDAPLIDEADPNASLIPSEVSRV